MNDLISRKAAIDALRTCYDTETISMDNGDEYINYGDAVGGIEQLPSAEPESTRTFVELVAEYPDPELCTYKEYKGKPYYSIKYVENSETHVGYGTYNLKVLSQYLKEYFIPSAQPEIIRCKDCKYKYMEDMIWHCPFGLMGGENFFCGYGSLEAVEMGGDNNDCGTE